MKTSKFALVIAMLFIASANYAGIDPGPNPYCVKTSLKKALQNRSLVRTMYEQLDMSFIQVDQNGLYIAKVNFRGHLYWIYGTYEEWIKFFTMDPTDFENITITGKHVIIKPL